MAAAMLPVAIAGALAIARWRGNGPFGSDNDEYRLLAGSLLEGSTQIAGVEGTKYPVGYSAILALFDGLGLPMTGTAIALNLLLVGVLAVLVWRLVPPGAGLLGRSIGASLAVGSLGLWDSVYVTMPDLGFVALCALVPAWLERGDLAGRSIAPSALAVAAVALKSAGIAVAVALSVAVALQPRRKVFWMPAVAGLVALGLQNTWSGAHPEHQTGYRRTFWLVDPFDASRGSLGWTDLPARAVERFGLVLGDLGEAVVGPVADGDSWEAAAAAAASVLFVAVAVLALPSSRGFTIPFLGLYLAMLLVWPYSSPRFGLVLLPYAAVGSGVVAGAAARRIGQVPAMAALGALLVPYVVWSTVEASDKAAAEASQVAELEEGIEQLQAWMTANAEGDLIASLDYRELALRTDRTYLPLGYTMDAREVWSRSSGRGAKWLVVLRGLYGPRDRVVANLVDEMPGSVLHREDFGPVAVYELVP